MVREFGEFEFDDQRRELRIAGRPVRLTGQALDLLQLLLERAGDVVTREEIRAAMWPTTNVDFEHGLDVAVSRLRTVLGDRNPHPRYIQTLPRKGYRLIEPVVVTGELRSSNRLLPWARRFAAYAGVAILAAVLGIVFAHTRYNKVVSPHVSHAAPASRHQ
ncbi:MAG TPA: winged helix-turn-helix domain-containing protein [Thermoanaerobaculia bacterium]|nr:winged helix-turn-helix domain-containing protein [Thermoanaerobaculia bacterium]